MAHKISTHNGRAEMAYSGETPWHGLGTKVDGLATPQEMVKHAGLDWTVTTVPLVTGDGQAVPTHVAIRRDDSRVVLGVAGARYTPIQNTQAAEVMDALVTEGAATVEVCGALDQGHRCWMLSRLPETFEVVRGDAVQPYVLLAWGHDGQHGLAAKLTPIRVVCNNTLTMALGKSWNKSADVYVRHTPNAKLQLEAAQTALGLVRKQMASTAAAYTVLAATPVDSPAAAGYFAGLVTEPVRLEDKKEERYERSLARWNEAQARMLALFESGKGTEIAGVRGTAWAAYNAVTEFLDHVYPVLQNGKVSAARQESVLFGGYSDLKKQALTSALALAN